MGIVEQFSLEVVMPTNSDHHSARKSPSVGHGRCGTFPYSLYVSPRSVSLLRSFRYVRFEQGGAAQKSRRAYQRAGRYKHTRKPEDRCGIADGVDACDVEAAWASLSLVLSPA